MRLISKYAKLILWLPALLATLSYGQIGTAQTLSYEPTLNQADWLATSSIFECKLKQDIPAFGEALFYQRAGERLEFQLQDYNSQLAKDIVRFSAKPAIWNNIAHVKKIGVIDISEKIDTGVAMDIIGSLLNRMMPTFEGSAKHRYSQSLVISLSPVKFKRSYAQYQKCVHELLPVNYDQIKRTVHHWPMEGVVLNDEIKDKLDNIAIYINAVESITGITIDSYTDTAGTRRFNQAISDERVLLVSNYLVEKGVDINKIVAQGHGEDKEFLLISPEKSEEDKNQNRRLVLTLARD